MLAASRMSPSRKVRQGGLKTRGADFGWPNQTRREAGLNRFRIC